MALQGILGPLPFGGIIKVVQCAIDVGAADTWPGICPQVEIQFKGKRVCCLLDTESQVTLMTEDYYRRVFPEQGLGSRGVVGWLSLRAANGIEHPYVDYALMDGQVGELNGAVCGIWEAAFQDCRWVWAQSSDEVQGVLRPAYRHPPDHSEVVLWARVPSGVKSGQCVLVEPLDQMGAVYAVRTIGVVKCGCVPVRVRHLIPFHVSLGRYQRLATMTCNPSEVKDPDDLELTAVSPGILEVGVRKVAMEVGQEEDLTELALHGEGLSKGQELSALLQKQKLPGLLILQKRSRAQFLLPRGSY
ncbi:UNVERIFIED_CONTAM: hypothetical protein FKN15_058553 [Acipenser sinensis]